ncbi:uncharacterized protein H6S33_008152 [Morchella sextelata]|uniref:uncharacterized protein n=1 Tax=Morchella sextelata TaxID=1174677 RepID=UPI001D05C195|nr:uncharacterized protein H6S33_008152 [Morchella sextelata]KAH0603148.1 hypothetical protein H6S33_008152 [Morchella sextelata]
MVYTRPKPKPIPRVTRAGARKAAEEEARAAAQEEECEEESEEESDEEQSSVSISDVGEDDEGSVDQDGMHDVIYVGGRSTSPVYVSSDDEDEIETVSSVQKEVEIPEFSDLQEQLHRSSDVQETESVSMVEEVERFDHFSLLETRICSSHVQEETHGVSSVGEWVKALEIEIQEQFPHEIPEQQLSFAPVAPQPQPRREVTPEEEDMLHLPVNFTGAKLRSREEVEASLLDHGVGWEFSSGSDMIDAADDVHSEGDELSAIVAYHAGLDGDFNMFESGMDGDVGIGDDGMNDCADIVSDTGIDDGTEVPGSIRGDGAASGLDLHDYSFLLDAASEVIPGYPHTAEESSNQIFGPTVVEGHGNAYVDPFTFDFSNMVAPFGHEENTQPSNAYSWTDFNEPQALDTSGEHNSHMSPPNIATTWAFSSSLVDPALDAPPDDPVAIETQSTELSQNTLADVTGDELQPARASTRRTTTPSTRKTRARKPRKPKAIAASKQQRVESVPEIVGHEALSPSHPDYTTFTAIQTFLGQQEGGDSTDVQMSGLSDNTFSVVVPALPTVVAGASSSSTTTATVNNKKRVRTKTYVRAPRTKAAKAHRHTVLLTANEELDECLADAQRRAAIDPCTIPPTDGPVEFRQGPVIQDISGSRSEGTILVTWANKGDMPVHIELAYLERVKAISKNTNGASGARKARVDGTMLNIHNLPELPRWICSVCDAEFPTHWKKKLHSKTHPEAHSKCEHCGKNYSRQHTLLRHLNVSHPHAIKFRCACLKVFSKGKALIKHQKKCDIHIASINSNHTNSEVEQTGESSASQERTNNDEDVVMGNTGENEGQGMVDRGEDEEGWAENGSVYKGKQVYRY